MQSQLGWRAGDGNTLEHPGTPSTSICAVKYGITSSAARAAPLQMALQDPTCQICRSQGSVLCVQDIWDFSLRENKPINPVLVVEPLCTPELAIKAEIRLGSD